MEHKLTNNTLTIYPEGRIDSANATIIENELMSLLEKYEDMELVIDAQSVEYISSAGLRILLKIRKKKKTNFRYYSRPNGAFEEIIRTGKQTGSERSWDRSDSHNLHSKLAKTARLRATTAPIPRESCASEQTLVCSDSVSFAD